MAAVALLVAGCGGASGPDQEAADEQTAEEQPAAGSEPSSSSGTDDSAPDRPASTAATGRRVRPVPGPPSPAFFPDPVQWYEELKDLDPQRCASLVRDLADLDAAEPDDEYSYELFARFVFRGAARGCANQLGSARSDLGCARFIQGDVVRERDPAVDEILDWAVDAYGPASRGCRHRAVSTSASSSSTTEASTAETGTATTDSSGAP